MQTINEPVAVSFNEKRQPCRIKFRGKWYEATTEKSWKADSHSRVPLDLAGHHLVTLTGTNQSIEIFGEDGKWRAVKVSM